MLSFVERMANADGLSKRVKKGNNVANKIKCNLMEKKDILEIFRHKYAWYFKNKYENELDKKKKHDF